MEARAGVALTAIINLVMAAFVYGRLTNAVSNLDQRTGKVENNQGKVWEKLSDHSERIVRLESSREK